MQKKIVLSIFGSALIWASGPVYKTGQTYTISNGDDSYYQSGLTPSFTVNSNGTIRDNYLQLLWENNHTQDTMTFEQAKKYCDNLSLAGRSDWRLPSRLEAKSIVTYKFALTPPSIFDPFAASTVFGNSIDPAGKSRDQIIEEIRALPRYWSESSDVSIPTKAWPVEYRYGSILESVDKNQSNYVRCVSGEKLSSSSYLRNNGIVLDRDTGLMWQDDYADNNNTVFSGTWTAALAYCENLDALGYSDWRLPNFNELFYISDDTRANPAIDPTFKVTMSAKYWSSSFFKQATKYKGVVSFASGADSIKDKDDTSEATYVRCVRGEVKRKIKAHPSLMMYLLN